jgi:hypothetical protein
LLFADPGGIGFAFHWASIPQGGDAEKQNESTLRVTKYKYWHLETKNLCHLSFPQRKLLSTFPLSSSQRQWKNYFSLRPLRLERSHAGAGQAGGEYKLTYLYSKAEAFSLAKILMD